MPLILRIALWACFFTLIFLSTTWMFNSCKSETNQAIEAVDAVAESTEDVMKSVEENVKEVTDELFEDSDEIIYTNEEEEENNLANDLFQEVETDDEVQATPERKRTTTPEPTRVRSSFNGNYLVVAGNYLVESNAEEMVKKLRTMGFTDASHIVFDQSQYYTVVASRSESHSGAQSSSATLKAKGVDNYVHTQRD